MRSRLGGDVQQEHRRVPRERGPSRAQAEDGEDSPEHEEKSGEEAQLLRPDAVPTVRPLKNHDAGDRERGETPLRPAQAGECGERARQCRRPRAANGVGTENDRESGEREGRGVPDAVTHAEDRPARARHEDERRNRQSGPQDGGEREKERRENAERSHDAGRHQGREARPEHAKEDGVETGSERAEPVHDVAIEALSPSERVGDDPFPSRVDQDVGPPAAGDDEERDGRGRERRGAGDPDSPAPSSRQVTIAGRSRQRSHARDLRISSMVSKARSSSSSAV